jgi:hypothetical protein
MGFRQQTKSWERTLRWTSITVMSLCGLQIELQICNLPTSLPCELRSAGPTWTMRHNTYGRSRCRLLPTCAIVSVHGKSPFIWWQLGQGFTFMRPGSSPFGSARAPTRTPAFHSRSMSEMRAADFAAFNTVRRHNLHPTSRVLPKACQLGGQTISVKENHDVQQHLAVQRPHRWVHVAHSCPQARK